MRNIHFLLLILSTNIVVGQNDHEAILLKDYLPVSIYETPATDIKKARFNVIDMHSHSYPNSETELDDWIITMDKAGIKKTIILTYAYGDKFDSLVSVYSRHKDRFELWCGFDYSTYNDKDFPEKAVKELERCYKNGARGIGELGDKGKGLFYCQPSAWGMHPDDERMVPLFAKCAELKLPVNIHVAEPKWMYEKMDASNDGMMNAFTWRLDNREGIVDHSGMISILDNTLKKNPNTTFVACHLANCCYNLKMIGELIDKHPNLFIDISARFAEFAPIPRNAKNFFLKYQDRIVYGTDMGTDYSMYQITFRILETADEHFYDHSHFSYHWPLYGLDLPDEVLEKVYHDNAEKILDRIR